MTGAEELRARLLRSFSPLTCEVQVWENGRRLRLRVRDESGQVLMDLSSLSLPAGADGAVLDGTIRHLRALCRPGA
ncbi:hypothetical protein VQH23_09340 [Pararoseomonas sp. SCSIO 73927]|uniref:hypothetical protein n=1 Tax=Pararoseomonas sp. SCSIO 73927 TaxID=3114537 RepID=UPI0030D28FCE